MSYYQKTSPRVSTLVARQGYSGVGGVFDDIVGAVKSGAGAVINFYGQSQQNAGAAALAAQQAAAQQPGYGYPAPASGGGISTGTLLVVGGAALGLFLLMRK